MDKPQRVAFKVYYSIASTCRENRCFYLKKPFDIQLLTSKIYEIGGLSKDSDCSPEIYWLDDEADLKLIANDEDLHNFMLLGTEVFQLYVFSLPKEGTSSSLVIESKSKELMHAVKKMQANRDIVEAFPRKHDVPEEWFSKLQKGHSNQRQTISTDRPTTKLSQTCNQCGCNVENIHYKCLICRDYYLCRACKNTKVHSFHPLIIPLSNAKQTQNVSNVVRKDGCAKKDDINTVTGDKNANTVADDKNATIDTMIIKFLHQVFYFASQIDDWIRERKHCSSTELLITYKEMYQLLISAGAVVVNGMDISVKPDGSVSKTRKFPNFLKSVEQLLRVLREESSIWNRSIAVCSKMVQICKTIKDYLHDIYPTKEQMKSITGPAENQTSHMTQETNECQISPGSNDSLDRSVVAGQLLSDLENKLYDSFSRLLDNLIAKSPSVRKQSESSCSNTSPESDPNTGPTISNNGTRQLVPVLTRTPPSYVSCPFHEYYQIPSTALPKSKYQKLSSVYQADLSYGGRNYYRYWPSNTITEVNANDEWCYILLMIKDKLEENLRTGKILLTDVEVQSDAKTSTNAAENPVAIKTEQCVKNSPTICTDQFGVNLSVNNSVTGQIGAKPTINVTGQFGAKPTINVTGQFGAKPTNNVTGPFSANYPNILGRHVGGNQYSYAPVPGQRAAIPFGENPSRFYTNPGHFCGNPYTTAFTGPPVGVYSPDQFGLNPPNTVTGQFGNNPHAVVTSQLSTNPSTNITGQFGANTPVKNITGQFGANTPVNNIAGQFGIHPRAVVTNQLGTNLPTNVTKHFGANTEQPIKLVNNRPTFSIQFSANPSTSNILPGQQLHENSSTTITADALDTNHSNGVITSLASSNPTSNPPGPSNVHPSRPQLSYTLIPYSSQILANRYSQYFEPSYVQTDPNYSSYRRLQNGSYDFSNLGDQSARSSDTESGLTNDSTTQISTELNNIQPEIKTTDAVESVEIPGMGVKNGSYDFENLGDQSALHNTDSRLTNDSTDPICTKLNDMQLEPKTTNIVESAEISDERTVEDGNNDDIEPESLFDDNPNQISNEKDDTRTSECSEGSFVVIDKGDIYSDSDGSEPKSIDESAMDNALHYLYTIGFRTDEAELRRLLTQCSMDIPTVLENLIFEKSLLKK